jgi:predicted transcriptional regulator
VDGWFKLHRSIVDSSVFEDAEVLKLWIWLLCNVAYSEHDVVFCGKVIHINVGEIPTGSKKISQQTNMSESKVYRALNIFKKLGNIKIKSNNKYSIITVANWEKYQGEMQNFNIKTTAERQQNNNRTTAKKQQKNTTKESNKYKEKKEIKEKTAPSGDLPDGYSLHPNSGEVYTVIDGVAYNIDGRKLNSAGFIDIDFGLSKHHL